MCYCIHIRVTPGEGRDDHPPLSHIWSGSPTANILQEACPGDQITEVVVLVPGEAILFFGRHSLKEGLLYHNAQDVELGLRGPVNWSRRIVQIKVTVNTVQDSNRDIMDAMMEKKTKVTGYVHPQGSREDTWPSASSCNVDDWM